MLNEMTLIQPIWIGLVFSFCRESCKIMGEGGRVVNKLALGMVLSFIGILIVCLTILGFLPGSTNTAKFVSIGIGWVLIIAGSVVRFKDLKAKQ